MGPDSQLPEGLAIGRVVVVTPMVVKGSDRPSIRTLIFGHHGKDSKFKPSR